MIGVNHKRVAQLGLSEKYVRALKRCGPIWNVVAKGASIFCAARVGTPILQPAHKVYGASLGIRRSFGLLLYRNVHLKDLQETLQQGAQTSTAAFVDAVLHQDEEY